MMRTDQILNQLHELTSAINFLLNLVSQNTLINNHIGEGISIEEAYRKHKGLVKRSELRKACDDGLIEFTELTDKRCKDHKRKILNEPSLISYVRSKIDLCKSEDSEEKTRVRQEKIRIIAAGGKSSK